MLRLIYLSALFFTLAVSQPSAIKRAVFKNDRRLAECKYYADEKNVYDLDFYFYNVKVDGIEYCTDITNRRQNLPPFHVYFAETGVHKSFRPSKIFDLVKMENDTGFYFEVKSGVDAELMNQFCYVCDKTPKRAKESDAFTPNDSSFQAWDRAYQIVFVDPPKVENFGDPEPLQSSDEMATASKAGSVERLHGNDLKLRCSASGNVSSLHIKRGSQIVKSAESNSLSVELQLNNLNSKDTDTYTCLATAPEDSLFREYQTSSMSLHVNVGYPPKFSVVKKIYYTTKGAMESLKVRIRAFPEPKLDCGLMNGISEPRTIQSDNTERMSIFTVTIPKVEEKDVGEFNCTASNKYGSQSLTFELRLRPGDLNITSGDAVHSNYIKLDWQVRTNENAPIKSYKITVKYMDKDTSEWKDLGTPQFIESFNNKNNTLAKHHTDKEVTLVAHNLFGLKPGLEHEVELVANNEFGESDAVKKKFLTKPDGVAFKNPETAVKPMVDHGQDYKSASRSTASTTLFLLLCVVWQRLL